MTDPILDIRFPPELVTRPDGLIELATVEQDSPEEIRCGLVLACELRPGDLPWAEPLGIPDPLGETDPALAAAGIASALRAIDPRPAQIVVDVLDTADDRELHLKVTT